MSVAARCHQFAAGTLLAGDLADPGMCVHLWPGMGPGAVEAFGDGLAAAGAAAEVAVDELRAAVVEEVEALAMLSPSARVAPSTAAPAAVPMSGLVILTRFSFAVVHRAPDGTGPGDPCAARLVAGAGRVIPYSPGGGPGRAGWPARSQYARPA